MSPLSWFAHNGANNHALRVLVVTGGTAREVADAFSSIWPEAEWVWVVQQVAGATSIKFHRDRDNLKGRHTDG